MHCSPPPYFFFRKFLPPVDVRFTESLLYRYELGGEEEIYPIRLRLTPFRVGGFFPRLPLKW